MSVMRRELSRRGLPYLYATLSLRAGVSSLFMLEDESEREPVWEGRWQS